MKARARLRLTSLAAGLAALGACEPSGTPIDMANPPHTKPGAWVETGTQLGQPIKPFSFCDPGRPVFPPKDATCSEWRAVRTADGAIDATAECAKYGAKLHMHRRIVGDLASAFSEDITSVMEAPNEPKSTLSAHRQFRYLGACPPGLRLLQSAAGQET
jgi:hypothetical protein